jgi:hypothetical protein
MESGTNLFSISKETLNSLGMNQEEFVQAFKGAIQELRIEDMKKRMEEENRNLEKEVEEMQVRILLGIELPDDLPISDDLRGYLFRVLSEERLNEIREILTPEGQGKLDEGIRNYRQD